MTALVSVETVLLVLLVVLVAGLLRSHAEILRRLGPGTDSETIPQPPTVTRAGATGAGASGRRPPPLAGASLDDDPVTLAFDGARSRPTLLAFLTSGCGTCAGFWETLAEPRLSPEVQIVIVTHGPEHERPAKLRALRPDGVPVVMSSSAWSDYKVPGAPYFVLVDGEVRGEGVATTWPALASLVADAIEDAATDGSAGARRAESIDATLAAAGIGPDHPSLYPSRRP
jgi:hypothetical protein